MSEGYPFDTKILIHSGCIFHGTSCHHRPEVYGGIDERPAAELLKAFFAERRDD